MNNIELPVGWKLEPLNNIANITMGQSPPSSSYNEDNIGLPFFQGKTEFGEMHPSAVKYCSAPMKIAEKSDILISVRAPVGPVNIAPSKCCIGRGLSAIRALKGKTDDLFLFYYLRSIETKIAELGQGSTFTAIGKKDLENILVPMPPNIETQKCIASILNKANILNHKRDQANQITNKILQALFVKMFGDPATNSKGWEITTIGDHAKIRYGTGSPPPYEKSGIPFVRATNIKMGKIVKHEMRFISLESAKRIEKCKLHEGNLLLVRSGVNTGDCAYVTREYDGSYAAYDLILDLDGELNSRFIWGMLNLPYCRAIMKPLTVRAAQPHINAEQVSSIKVPKPPVELQRRFAKFIERLHVLQEGQSQSTQRINELLRTLMYKAFKGDLVLEAKQD